MMKSMIAESGVTFKELEKNIYSWICEIGRRFTGEFLERYDRMLMDIGGFNSENGELNEGVVKFDIAFYVRMNHIHLTNDNVLSSYEWKGKRDLLNIVMIGLAEELLGHDERYELHRLFGALLSKELAIDEKLNIIGKEDSVRWASELSKVWRLSLYRNMQILLLSFR